MEVPYTAHATASGGGRDGRSATDDGKIDVKLSTPAEMGGRGGDGRRSRSRRGDRGSRRRRREDSDDGKLGGG